MMDLEYAEGWRPEPGAVLVGKVTDVALGWSNFANGGTGGNYPIVTVEPEGGGEPVAVHGFHVGLFSQFRQLRPVPGERIGIQYKGKRPQKANPSQEVAVYVVKIDGRTADVWGSLAQSAESEARVQRQQGFTPATDTAPATSGADDKDDIPF